MTGAYLQNQKINSMTAGFPALLVLLIAFILVQLLLTAADIKMWLQLYNIKLYDRYSLFFFSLGKAKGEWYDISNDSVPY